MNVNLSYLDRVRLLYGIDAVKAEFRELRNEKANLINDESLLFATLFTLMAEIDELNLYEYLNTRNIIAMKICKKILNEETLLTENSVDIISALKWILKTGANDDGLSSEFDRILDGTASLLICTYSDKTMLPFIADIIFKRNRKGEFIHDLVWAFFNANNLEVLKIIAGFLLSNYKDDVDLAYKLLNIEPKSDRYRQYISYLSWFKKNYPYIVFTGESFNLTSNPNPISLNMGDGS